MQDETTKLATTSLGAGLRINKEKTKLMRINTPTTSPVTIDDRPIQEVDSFTYLGSIIDKQGGTDSDVTARVGKARAAFIILKNIWASREIATATKVRIFNSNVKSVLLYGSETWRMTKKTLQKIQTFINSCLKRIFRIWWPDKISNKELWQRGRQEPVENQIRRRKWGWIGHTLRKPASTITRHVLTWNPQGKRKRGRPKNSWRRDTEADLKIHGTSWGEAEKTAQSRDGWRRVVEGLCSSGDKSDGRKYIEPNLWTNQNQGGRVSTFD